MRLRTPIRQRGARTERWAKHHERSRNAVMLRAGFKCEGCGTNMRPLEWAHLAGRGNIISEPWCSTPELTAGLCSGKWDELGCHEKVDRHLDDALLDRLRWKALGRLWATYPDGCDDYNQGSALEDIRATIRHIEEKGFTFDFESQRIIKLAPVVEI